jgi:hypothetical protein
VRSDLQSLNIVTVVLAGTADPRIAAAGRHDLLNHQHVIDIDPQVRPEYDGPDVHPVRHGYLSPAQHRDCPIHALLDVEHLGGSRDVHLNRYIAAGSLRRIAGSMQELNVGEVRIAREDQRRIHLIVVRIGAGDRGGVDKRTAFELGVGSAAVSASVGNPRSLAGEPRVRLRVIVRIRAGTGCGRQRNQNQPRLHRATTRRSASLKSFLCPRMKASITSGLSFPISKTLISGRVSAKIVSNA